MTTKVAAVEFVQLPLPVAAVYSARQCIEVELREGALTPRVAWPASLEVDFASWTAGAAAMTRIDAAWLAISPLDMRSGVDTALVRVVAAFGAARPHHVCLYAHKCVNCLKILVHDGIGIWLAARRLHQGKFI